MYTFNILPGIFRVIQRGGYKEHFCGTTATGYMLHFMATKKNLCHVVMKRQLSLLADWWNYTKSYLASQLTEMEDSAECIIACLLWKRNAPILCYLPLRSFPKLITRSVILQSGPLSPTLSFCVSLCLSFCLTVFYSCRFLLLLLFRSLDLSLPSLCLVFCSSLAPAAFFSLVIPSECWVREL